MEGNPSTTNPKVVLPAEILLQILQDYFVFRHDELLTRGNVLSSSECNERRRYPRSLYPVERGKGAYHPIPGTSSLTDQKVLVGDHPTAEPQWEALPLLSSCRQLSTIATAELYRDIFLLEDYSLYKLVKNSRLSALKMIKSFDIRHVEGVSDCHISGPVRLRLIQSQCSSLPQYTLKGDWDSAIDEPGRFDEYWSAVHKPCVEILKASADLDTILPYLLQL